MLKRHRHNLLLFATAVLSLGGFLPDVSSFVTVLQSPIAFRGLKPIPDHRRLLVSKEDMVPPKPSKINNDDKEIEGTTNGEAKVPRRIPRKHFFTYIPRKVSHIYREYFSRLWKETDVTSRRQVAKEKAVQSIRQVQNIFRNQEEYADISKVSQLDRQNLLDACDSILKDSERAEELKETVAEAENITEAIAAVAEAAKEEAAVGPKKKKGRSVLFGAAMGAVVAAWVFSGNYVFTAIFTGMTILGQLEYYRMVMKTGVFPTRRLSVIGAASMFLTVCMA